MSSCCIFSIAFFSFFIIFSTTIVTSHNITKILADDSDFSNFNAALTQSNVADEINNHSTITVLVVDNSKLSSLLGQSKETLRKIMRIHVLLQYYDADGFKNLPNKTSSIPTLYQASSFARGLDGFINVTEKDGQVVLGSGSAGSKIDVTLVKSVFKQPYNISVVQISDAIIPSGGGSSPSPEKPPAKAPSPSKGKAPPRAPAPARAPAGSPEPAAADAPSGSPPAMAPGSPFASPPGADGPIADISPSGEKNAAAFVGMDGLTMLLVALSSAWIAAKMT